MPIIPNSVQTSIELNNSFSTIPSGSANGFVYKTEGGYLFSNSGFNDNSFSLKEGSVVRSSSEVAENLFLNISLSPKELFATGISILNKEEENIALLDDGEISFYCRSFSKEGSENLINSNIIFLKHSGDQRSSFSNNYKGFLTKNIDDEFIFQFVFGRDEIREDDDSDFISNEKSVKINFGNESGQKIFYLRMNYDGGNKFFKNNVLLEDYFLSSEEEAFSGRSDNGVLLSKPSFESRVPIFLIDFEKELVVNLFKSQQNVSLDTSSMGVNNIFLAGYV